MSRDGSRGRVRTPGKASADSGLGRKKVSGWRWPKSPSKGGQHKEGWVGCSGVNRSPGDTAGAPHTQLPTEQSGVSILHRLPLPSPPLPPWQSGRKAGEPRVGGGGRGGSREMLLTFPALDMQPSPCMPLSTGLGIRLPRSPSTFGAECFESQLRLGQARGFPCVAQSPAQRGSQESRDQADL